MCGFFMVSLAVYVSNGCSGIFKVKATIFLNVNATGVSVKVGATPCCI